MRSSLTKSLQAKPNWKWCRLKAQTLKMSNATSRRKYSMLKVNCTVKKSNIGPHLTSSRPRKLSYAARSTKWKLRLLRDLNTLKIFKPCLISRVSCVWGRSKPLLNWLNNRRRLKQRPKVRAKTSDNAKSKRRSLKRSLNPIWNLSAKSDTRPWSRTRCWSTCSAPSRRCSPSCPSRSSLQQGWNNDKNLLM